MYRVLPEMHPVSFVWQIPSPVLQRYATKTHNAEQTSVASHASSLAHHLLKCPPRGLTL